MSVKKSNKQLYRVIQIMTLTGTLVVANVLFTMVTHRHIWSGQDVLDTQIASSIVNTSVEAKRGTIYDRNHNVIAQEVTAYTVVAYLDDSLEDEDGNPDYVKDADYTAKQLGTVLDNINEEKVAKIIEDAIDDERSQTELGTGTKRLDKDTMEKIKDLNLPGIDFIETTNRNYPTTPFSSNLIGFAAYDEEKEKIYVYVTGQVNIPGVVILDKGSRISDAINAAGGTTAKANTTKINLVYVLEDGMKVNIPSNEELKKDTKFEYITKDSGDEADDEKTLKEEDKGTTTKKERSSNIVNINTATQTELETLPGIGPSTALKIINYRKENGKFSNIEDLKNVNGIGENKFEALKKYITV